jgi:hypothetical protein
LWHRLHHTADWDRVRAVAGDLMEPTDYWPPRLRVRECSTLEQLREMGAEQTN